MTDAERQRIGRKLRALRIERGLDQIPAAEKAGISVGTLQAIEIPKKHDVKDSNIEKYAQVFGTTVTKLLKADTAALSPTDPRLDDLNDEHLDIARSYMRAKRLPRQAIEALLSHPPAEDALISLFFRLHAMPPERVVELNRWLVVAPDLFTLLEQVGRRMIHDLNYAAIIRESLAVRDQQPIPPATLHPKPKPATPHKRRRRA